MSRQLDLKAEERETAKRNALVKALDYGLPGSLEFQGIQLLGFSVKYEPWSVLLTLRADVGGIRKVAHVGSDTLINCFLKCDLQARSEALRWEVDKYHAS